MEVAPSQMSDASRGWETELNAVENQLVDLFVQYLGNEPETQPEYQAVEQLHGAETNFDRTRLLLRKWRKSFVEMYKEGEASKNSAAAVKGELAQRHAIKCLHSIKQEQKMETRRVVAQFAYKALSAAWREDQRTRFCSVAQKLIEGYDYFLSFTGRNPNTHVAKLRVNREYDEFIHDVLTADKISSSKMDEDNLLATAIDALLKEQQRNGFFYPDRRGDGAIVRDKLKIGLKRSLSFVQLLDNEMFILDQDVKENFCYFEYQGAIENQLEMLFLLPYANRADLLREEERLMDLDDWYQKILKVDLRLLPPAPMLQKTSVSKIHTEIINLAEQIRTARNAAIESVTA
jgi:hypothetical protein